MAPSHITSSGVIFDWPAGFAESLPAEPWLVVHCKPRQEKLLARQLQYVGIPGCAFFERRRRQYVSGVQESLVPLLGGYVFVAHDRFDRDPIYQTERVLRIFDVPRPEQLQQDLNDLKALISRAGTGLAVRSCLQPGSRVVIRRGIFTGVCGIIERRQGACMVVVNIHALGHSVAMHIDAEDVDADL
jgi:hypothetical protein